MGLFITRDVRRCHACRMVLASIVDVNQSAHQTWAGYGACEFFCMRNRRQVVHFRSQWTLYTRLATPAAKSNNPMEVINMLRLKPMRLDGPITPNWLDDIISQDG